MRPTRVTRMRPPPAIVLATMIILLSWRALWAVLAAAVTVALVFATNDGVLVVVAEELFEASSVEVHVGVVAVLLAWYAELCFGPLVNAGLMLLSEQPTEQEKFDSAQQPTLRYRISR